MATESSPTPVTDAPPCDIAQSTKPDVQQPPVVVTTSPQQVIYHVYQHSPTAHNFEFHIPCNLEVRSIIRPGFLALLWAVWVLFLAGISKVDLQGGTVHLTHGLYSALDACRRYDHGFPLFVDPRLMQSAAQ